MRFNQQYIQDNIVNANYKDVDGLIEKLGLHKIEENLINQANVFKGAKEEGLVSHDIDENAIDIDQRTPGCVTYVDGEIYTPGAPLEPILLIKKERSYLQYDHSKPLCSLLNHIYQRILIAEKEKQSNTINYFENPEEQKRISLVIANTASAENFTRIFRKIGDKYYYISIESNIKLTNDSQSPIPFECISIFEINEEKKLKRVGMYVPSCEEKEKADKYKIFVENGLEDLINLLPRSNKIIEVNEGLEHARSYYQQVLEAFNPQETKLQFLKQQLKDLNPVTRHDFLLLTLVIITSKDPNRNPLEYNDLIMSVIRSGIGNKTKHKYDAVAYNPLVTAMYVISGLSVFGFLMVACAPLVVSSIGILALEYCVGGVITASITNLVCKDQLKTWSPLRDSMEKINYKDNAEESISSSNRLVS